MVEFQICLNTKKGINCDSILSGKEEIIAAMEHFEEEHQKLLPKVDRRFVIDLFLRLREKPDEKPMIRLKLGLNQDEIPKPLETR